MFVLRPNAMLVIRYFLTYLMVVNNDPQSYYMISIVHQHLKRINDHKFHPIHSIYSSRVVKERPIVMYGMGLVHGEDRT